MTLTAAVSTPPARRAGRPSSGGFGLALVAPTVVLLLLVQAYPLLQGLWLSLTRTSLVRPRGGTFVGVDNYVELVADPRLLYILQVTLVYTALSVVGSLAVGMVTALVMDVGVRGRGLLRAILTVPWAAPGVATALVFIWMLDGQYGVLNYFVTWLPFVDDYQRWLNDPALAMPAVVVVTIWKVFPFAAIALLAAMQAIPRDLYEAAAMDGASPWRQFWTVTLPMLRPTFVFVVILSTIGGLQLFVEPLIFNNGNIIGGTQREFQTVQMYMFENSIQNLSKAGYGAAVAWALFLMIVVVSILNFVITRRSVKQ